MSETRDQMRARAADLQARAEKMPGRKVAGEFKAFILRGNLVDLAVAVVIGAAFSGVVTALVKDIFTPLIAAIGGQKDFSNLKFTINKSQFLYGDFLNTLISFLVVSFVIFFFVVKPVNALLSARKTEPEVASTTKECPECLSSIPVAAKRCAFCTSEQTIPAEGAGD